MIDNLQIPDRINIAGRTHYVNQIKKQYGEFSEEEPALRRWCVLSALAALRLFLEVGMKERFLKKPWMAHWNYIITRCTTRKHPYRLRGIKYFVNSDDIRRLWLRDKAYLMRQPSIDRINTNGNYTKENIRFVELTENVLRKRGEWAINFKCCRHCGKTDITHQARGLCRKCYRIWRNERVKGGIQVSEVRFNFGQSKMISKPKCEKE